MVNRLALTCTLSCLLAGLGTPQEPPALVGTWVLRVSNPAGLPLPDIKSQTIAITCVGNRIEISATTNGDESVVRFVADGKQRKSRTIPPLSSAEVESSRWEGTSLVVAMLGGSWVSGVSAITERWTPSLDGRTLTRSWNEFKTLAMVYDKQPAQAADLPKVDDSDEYAVYSAVLNSQLAYDESDQFVIAEKTITITSTPDLFSLVASAVKSDTLSDLKAKDAKSALLDRRFDLKEPYVLASEVELKLMFDPSPGPLINLRGWTSFYGQYPRAPGLIRFSRVGFNSTKDQALVYLSFQQNYLGGSARFLILSNDGKSWKVEKQIVTMFS